MRVAVQWRGKGSGTGNGKGTTMERNGKVKGKAGEKAGGKGRQGTERKARARSGQKKPAGRLSGAPPPGGVSENREERQGEQLEKRQGPDPARKSLRSGSAEEWQWQRHGKGSGKTMESMGKARERQGKGKGFKCWSLFRFRLNCRLEGFWFKV